MTVQCGGERMIEISTPAGPQRVWTRRSGEGATKLLLLHGGPGATHEYLLGLDSFLPQAGVEVYYYDQLGSGWSDNPFPAEGLLDVDRFVDEVEQVRTALGLEQFFLLGQSWGGILAIEYALAHQDALAGLVISNMMASIPAYNRYADEVLIPELDQERVTRIKQLEAEGRTDDPEYDDLLMSEHYPKHVLRLPVDAWPVPVVRSFSRINRDVYVPMQGPSELGASGILSDWDRFDDLARIEVPTLVISAQHDTMDPEHLRAMADRLPRGEQLHCPDGSHLAMYDDQEVYVSGLLDWLRRQTG